MPLNAFLLPPNDSQRLSMFLNVFHRPCHPPNTSQCFPNALPALPNASQCFSMPVNVQCLPNAFPILLHASACFSMPSKRLPIATQRLPAPLNVSQCLPKRHPCSSQCFSMPSKCIPIAVQCFPAPFLSAFQTPFHPLNTFQCLPNAFPMLLNAFQCLSMPSKRLPVAPNVLDASQCLPNVSQ